MQDVGSLCLPREPCPEGLPWMARARYPSDHAECMSSVFLILNSAYRISDLPLRSRHAEFRDPICLMQAVRGERKKYDRSKEGMRP